MKLSPDTITRLGGGGLPLAIDAAIDQIIASLEHQPGNMHPRRLVISVEFAPLGDGRIAVAPEVQAQLPKPSPEGAA